MVCPQRNRTVTDGTTLQGQSEEEVKIKEGGQQFSPVTDVHLTSSQNYGIKDYSIIELQHQRL